MKKIIYTAMAFLPTLALAAPEFGGISSGVDQVGNIIAKVIPIIFALGIIYFFWGLITFIKSAGNPEEAAKGKGIMIYGVIAIAVMVSIYGLISWLQGTFGINNVTNISLPKIPGY